MTTEIWTITRTTSNGIQEVLTREGFRSRECVDKKKLQPLYFTTPEGAKRVKELRDECRIPAMRKSIILNYS